MPTLRLFGFKFFTPSPPFLSLLLSLKKPEGTPGAWAWVMLSLPLGGPGRGYLLGSGSGLGTQGSKSWGCGPAVALPSPPHFAQWGSWPFPLHLVFFPPYPTWLGNCKSTLFPPWHFFCVSHWNKKLKRKRPCRPWNVEFAFRLWLLARLVPPALLGEWAADEIWEALNPPFQ